MSYFRAPNLRGLMLAGLIVSVLALPTRAADSTSDTSLKFVPAKAAFYSASFRNREQYDAVINSKAIAKLKALPFVQKAWKEGFAELSKPGGAIEQFNAFRKDPENQALLDLFIDMMSTETFVYGDESLLQLLDLYSKAGSANRTASIEMIKPENRGKDPGEIQAAAVLKVVNANHDKLQVPDVVIGFRLSDTERAEKQIKRLETLLTGPINQNPMTKGRLKRVNVDGKDFLTFTLDGSLIPLDELKEQLGKYEKHQADVDKLLKKIQSLKLTISLGVRGQYMLLSIGSGMRHIIKLGKGEALAGLPEFKPLAKYADKRIVELGYVSKELRRKVGYTKEDIDEFLKLGQEALKNADEIPEPLKKRLQKDIEELAGDVKKSITEVGAITSFGFLTPNGMESLSYDFSEHRTLDGSKPLTLTQHVGGNPILCAVDRIKYDPESYATTVKWMKKIYAYVDEFVVPQLDDNKKATYERVTKIVFPLLKRLDNATGKMLLPAFADGQNALVIDAKWTSKKWFPEQPESAKPLPMLELAIVFGVSDAEKARKGFEEYRAIINDILALANNFAEGQFPEAKIPEPKTKKLNGPGTMYFYPIPEVPGLDKRLLPNAGLFPSSPDPTRLVEGVLVLSLHEEMTERLLSKKPLKTECSLLQDLNRPLAGVTYFNFAGLIDAIAPWVDFAIDNASAMEKRPARGPEKPKPAKPAPRADDGDKEEIKKKAATVLEVLKCFRCAGTVWYFDGKALVTHTETVVKDVK
jgi:hypothetical protein